LEGSLLLLSFCSWPNLPLVLCSMIWEKWCENLCLGGGGEGIYMDHLQNALSCFSSWQSPDIGEKGFCCIHIKQELWRNFLVYFGGHHTYIHTYIREYFVNYAEKLFHAWNWSVTIYMMNTLLTMLRNASTQGIEVWLYTWILCQLCWKTLPSMGSKCNYIYMWIFCQLCWKALPSMESKCNYIRDEYFVNFAEKRFQAWNRSVTFQGLNHTLIHI